MKLLFIVLILLAGVSYTFFNEALIKFLDDDRYMDHKQNKLAKMIVGVAFIIGGIWLLIEYLFGKH